MSDPIKEWRRGNEEPTPKDSRPVYFEDINILRKEINRIYNIATAAITQVDDDKVDKAAGKELSDNNYTDALLALTGAADIVDLPKLLPVNAYVDVPYDVAENFRITAVSTDIDGELIDVEFVDPEDINQALAVSYDAELNIVTISHATDETGAISTAAGNLVTAINTDVEVGAIVQSEMGEAGTVDFVGTVSLDDYEYGKICKAGELFSDGNHLFIALVATDGVANETTDFKKITLVDI